MVREARLTWDSADGPNPFANSLADLELIDEDDVDAVDSDLRHLAAAAERPLTTQPPSSEKPSGLRKQISLFVPLEDWKLLRHAAARQNIPLTELGRRALKPLIERERRSRSA